MDLTSTHRETYDSLAEEYEARVPALRTVYEETVSYFAPHLKKGGRVLDVGCGVGLAIEVLTKRGFVAMGIELSSKMAEFAKRRNPEAEIIIGDFLTEDFAEPFDGIIALALVHLFPKDEAMQILRKMHDLLAPGGTLYIGTTESVESTEGWEVKEDYSGKHRRFRKHWTEEEFRRALEEAGFEVLELHRITDPFGKKWMDFVAQKPVGNSFPPIL